MARMYKCTRCESVFSDQDSNKKYTNGTKVLHGDLDMKRKRLYEVHLCPECSDKAFSWLWEIRFPKKGDE